MGPAPNLATYQAAAQAIYEPQKQAEQVALKATDTTTKNTLEAEKPQIQTDYQSAIDTLTNSVKDQTAKIGQLYANNLSGNFSGLQGNDMGNLFARANQQEGIIAATEANKLAAITTEEGNADITYQANLAALTPKYMSLETQYAQSNYASAVKDYNDTQYKNAELSISEAKLGISQAKLGIEASRLGVEASNKAQSDLNNYLSQFKSTGRSGGGFGYTGPNGVAINLGQFASSLAQGDHAQTLGIIRNQLQNDSTGEGKAALSYLNSQIQKYGSSYGQIIGAISNKKQFANLFNGM